MSTESIDTETNQTHLALVAVDQNRMVCSIHDDAQCSRDIALGDDQKRVFVWLDLHAKVCDAVLTHPALAVIIVILWHQCP